MLRRLIIENFRVFNHLEIKNLCQVNLITGKNNTGKTTLLEAIRIDESGGDSTVVNDILKKRGEFKEGSNLSYKSLFRDLTIIKDGSTFSGIKARINNNIFILQIPNNQRQINSFSEISIASRGSNPTDTKRALDPTRSTNFPNEAVAYIPFFQVNSTIQELWDKIVLTPLEDDVINVLRKTIDKRIVRLDVKDKETKIRLDNQDTPVSILTLGDGVQRVLQIAIALVSAKNLFGNKILLIDEFESGLHYTVQEKLWEMIFEYSVKWGIQVFATTHSLDAVHAFYYVGSREIYKNKGLYIRLQDNLKGDIEAVTYPCEDLESAINVNLELR